MSSPSYCARCGSPLGPSVAFCSKCGTPVSAPAADASAAPASSSGAPAPAWTPAANAPRSSMPRGWPAWLEIGVLVSGIGALLAFIGFLFGDAAISQTGSGGNFTTYQGDLEAFFVLTGFGILLIVGGYLYRVVDAARKTKRA